MDTNWMKKKKREEEMRAASNEWMKEKCNV